MSQASTSEAQTDSSLFSSTSSASTSTVAMDDYNKDVTQADALSIHVTNDELFFIDLHKLCLEWDFTKLFSSLASVVIEAIAYKGWDAKIWGNMLWRILVNIPTMVRIGGKEYRSDETPEIFIQILVTIFLNKGNKIDTIIERCPDDEVKNMMITLKDRLKIQSSINKDSPGSNYAITLARVCNAYPNYAINCLLNSKVKRQLVTASAMKLPADLEVEARVALTSGFIHHMWTNEFLAQGAAIVSLHHSVLRDRVINRTSSNRTSLWHLWQYHKNAILSDNVDADTRKESLLEWKLTVNNMEGIIAKSLDELKAMDGLEVMGNEHVEQIFEESKKLNINDTVRSDEDVKIESKDHFKKWVSNYLA